jgi:hypothetical protein
MIFFRRNRRFLAWLASVAIVFSALAPAISHAMSAGQDNGSWQEICSATGNKWILVTADMDIKSPVKNTDSKPASMQHCPYCITHAGSFALVADIQPAVINPDVSYSLPELFYHSPRPLFAWAASSPRAPPASS